MLSFLKKNYKYLRDNIFFLSFLSEFYNNRLNKKRENSYLSVAEKRGYKVVNVKEMYDKLNSHTFKTCHIVGLGWSLNYSKDLIKNDKNAFVIGMNYAAISDLKFDVYFCEPGSCTTEETNIRKSLIKDIVAQNVDHLFCKNAYEKDPIEKVLTNYGQYVTFLRSARIICRNRNNLRYWMKKLLEYDGKYLKQYKSTVISSIIFAKNAGFKKIVIHGLDFGGPYFYEDLQYVKPEKKKYIPPKNSRSTGKRIHQTAESSLGIDKVVPIIKDLLTNDGIELLAASHKSPLAELLYIYKN